MLTVPELVARAAAVGITVLAITDHDTVDHWPTVSSECIRHAVRPLLGAEISVVHRGLPLHILIYLRQAPAALLAVLDDQRQARIERTSEILDRVRELGFRINAESLAKSAGTVGRPAIARAVLADEENRDLLRKHGIAAHDEFFAKFLVRGGDCYAERRRVPAEDLLSIVREQGGVASLAHPIWSTRSRPESLPVIVDALHQCGLNAIEVYYPTHAETDVRNLIGLAAAHDLSHTAGSDFHFDGDQRSPRLGSWIASTSSSVAVPPALLSLALPGEPHV
jgi:predicted metal-dependent phosphoesterase TrpH